MDLGMEFDLRANDATAETRCDVIIIGGGNGRGESAARAQAVGRRLVKVKNLQEKIE